MNPEIRALIVLSLLIIVPTGTFSLSFWLLGKLDAPWWVSVPASLFAVIIAMLKTFSIRR